MTRKSLDDLGELQKAIMETVWELGEATVQQVLDRLRRKKRLAYTSVLSIMQRLEKVGWLRHRTEGRTYVYRPTLTREQESSRSLKRLTHLVFHGDTRLLFQRIIEDEDLSDEDLVALRQMIDERRKERGDA